MASDEPCTQAGGTDFLQGRQTVFVRRRGPWSQDGRARGDFATYTFSPTA